VAASEEIKQHMHKVGQQGKENTIRQRRVKKKKRQRSPDFTRKAQKCNERLMYKTKGVEPNPRVERNKSTSKPLKVLTQYNPQTLFEPL